MTAQQFVEWMVHVPLFRRLVEPLARALQAKGKLSGDEVRATAGEGEMQLTPDMTLEEQLAARRKTLVDLGIRPDHNRRRRGSRQKPRVPVMRGLLDPDEDGYEIRAFVR
jgi:hypothetical protein